MRKLSLLAILCAVFALTVSFQPSSAQISPPNPAQYRLVEVATGFTRPLDLVPANDGRLFIVEQDGRIKVRQNATTTTEFLNISSLVSRGGAEQGLLGMAFHPDYPQNGFFFVNYTNTAGDTVIARYKVSQNPNVADPNSAQQVLFVDQPYQNHNGGDLVFGPDGYLYIGLGDGGSAGDPENRAQNPQTLLGKMLRINVDQLPYTAPSNNPFVGNSAYRPEIWALGLRNPWRYSFDRLTNDLYIADVGQQNWEEVNFQAAGSPGGQNYGWSIYEGKHRFKEGNLPGTVEPFTEYNHDSGCSVTGGYVYRGTAMPGLAGIYFYGDFCSGRIWMAYRGGTGTWTSGQLFKDTAYSISSFGEDEAGELYFLDYNGKLVKIEPLAAPPTSTPRPPTATPVPPTSTGVPPTNTALPPINTPTNTPPAPTSPTLRAAFVPSAANPGEAVSLQLNLFNVANVYGLQVHCQVNPAVLIGGAYAEGEFNKANSFFVDHKFQPDGNWLVAASRLQPAAPISGNVTAFSLGYVVAGPGDSPATCTALAVDVNGQEVPLTVENGAFDGIEGPVTTEEPRQPTPTPIPTNTAVPPTATPVPPTEPPPPTNTPVPTALSSISGTAAYQNRPDDAGITVKLLDGNGTALVELTTNADGGFQFTDVPMGSYTLAISGLGHLAASQPVTVDADGQIIDAGATALRAGDTDGDGTIDLEDAALIGANYGVSVPPAPSTTDLNGDSLVNIVDLVLLGGNFGLGGGA